MLTPLQPAALIRMAPALDAGAILVPRPAERGSDVVSLDRKVFDDEGRLIAILPEQMNSEHKYVHHVHHRVVSDTDNTTHSASQKHRSGVKYGVVR